MANIPIWPGSSSFTTLQADPGTNRTALQALQIATESEYGAIYVDADKPTKKIEEPVVEEPKAEPVAEEPAVEDGFDPDAKDIDGDGFLQDGTPFQRPVEEK